MLMQLLKWLIFTLICLPAILSMRNGVEAAEEPLKELNQLQWKKRVILLHVDEQKLNETKRNLEEHNEGIVDRDIAWFVVAGGKIHTNHPGAIAPALRGDILSYFSGDYSVVLLGKDGGVKQRLDSLEILKIFDVIDSMPMRIREMRRQ